MTLPTPPKLVLDEFIATALSATPRELHPYFESFKTLYSRKWVCFWFLEINDKLWTKPDSLFFFRLDCGISWRRSCSSSSMSLLLDRIGWMCLSGLWGISRARSISCGWRRWGWKWRRISIVRIPLLSRHASSLTYDLYFFFCFVL